MGILEPTVLSLKQKIADVSNNVIEQDQDLVEAELERIGHMLAIAQNDTVSALDRKIGGTGGRSFGGVNTVTGNASNQGALSIVFDRPLPTAAYEVFVSPLGGTDTGYQYIGYNTRATTGFNLKVTTLVSGLTAILAWIVVY